MPLDPVAASLIGTALGGVIGLAGSIATTLLVRRSEERRHLRDIVIRTAAENWREMNILTERLNSQGKSFEYQTLDSYVFHMLKLAEVLDVKGITEEEVRRKIREVLSVSDAAADEIGKHHHKRT